ncbi:ankyrin-3 [Copidosoma floridanum]|uniref:ankyrin-3 n=1 Tax=Copidosoma floridanum TaxID=29053 RepID=UPI0006C940C3|nr:ankyrin-3 [Copidosoma floridanum]
MELSTEESLHEAVRSGDKNKVFRILQKSCINDWDQSLRTPLHMVYDHVSETDPTPADDRLPMMKLLVDYGADVNAQDGLMFKSALHMAIEEKQIGGLDYLLMNGANPNIADLYQCTALHYAARKGCEKMLKLLLNHKAISINVVSKADMTPLDTAINEQHVDVAKELVGFGAKSPHYLFNSESRRHIRPDWYIPFLEYLLENGAKIDSHGTFSFDALMYGLVFDRQSMGKNNIVFNLLHYKGIDIHNGVDGLDLHEAVRTRDITKVKAVLRKGADVNEKNKFNETPLHVILKQRNWTIECHEIARLLIERGSDLRAFDYMDSTPFFLAVRRQDLMIVNLMLKKLSRGKVHKRHDVYSTSIPKLHPRYDKTEPKLDELIVATTLGYEEVVDRLLEIDYIKEASKLCCYDVNRVLRKAVRHQRYDILKLLLEAGLRNDRRFTGKVPYYFSTLFTYYNKIGLKMAYLYWEYGDNTAINHAIIKVCRDIVEDSRNVNQFMYVVTFFYSISISLNKLHVDLIPTKGFLKKNNVMSEILSNCKKDLNKLKNVKTSDMSHYDIITMPFEAFVKALDKRRLNACRKLLLSFKNKDKIKYYEYVIENRINLAIEKKMALITAKDCLNKALEGTLKKTNMESLPDKIAWNILSHLNMRELKIIRKRWSKNVFVKPKSDLLDHSNPEVIF